MDVNWSTIDPVRFAEKKESEGESPIYLWIGVLPGSLSFGRAQDAAVGCQKILRTAGFPDIEVSLRESFFFKSKGPRLFKDDGDVLDIINGMVDIRNPFTPSLGVQIAPGDESSHEGTGALYFRESEASGRILLLTTRHVALPPSRPSSRLYSRKDPGSGQRNNIIILSDKAYKKAADTMLETLEAQQSRIRRSESFVKSFGEPTEGESPENIKKREHGYTSIAGARWIIKDVNKCQNEIKSWEPPENRVIGNVIYSPAISVTSDQCIEDWAMINIDPDVIDLETFQGNVLYLGGRFSHGDWKRKMRSSVPDFKYPFGRLFPAQGVVSLDELCYSNQQDPEGTNHFMVFKQGTATGATIGWMAGIKSVIRHHDVTGSRRTSMEVAVHSRHDDGPFSAPGDSGSIVVDGRGRIVGMIFGGSGLGTKKFADLTYITPYAWLEERIRKAFPDSFLYPTKQVEDWM
ncbi:hypothetical protein Agabi119p4_2375 [Agaricus bisporus var. burnettii]|uniref:Serine protease n=1 Tax=Agaricus bisporus var. burnettii TaxID=192524 RepID=A0A8H7KJX0_AGABI|nr:hypothetical protein Agabi119p4_2375 [Agaricus bisporus var. burnettii]